MGPLCTVFVDRVSEMIADHKKEGKSQVKNHIRTLKKKKKKKKKKEGTPLTSSQIKSESCSDMR